MHIYPSVYTGVGTGVRMKDSWMQTEEGMQDLMRPVMTSRGILCKRDDEDSSSDSKKSSSSSSSSSSPPTSRQHDSDYTPESSDSSSEEESSPQKPHKQTKKRWEMLTIMNSQKFGYVISHFCVCVALVKKVPNNFLMQNSIKPIWQTFLDWSPVYKAILYINTFCFWRNNCIEIDHAY